MTTAVAAMTNTLAHRATAEEPARAVLPCTRADPKLRFSQSPAELEVAKRHCRACPVQPACLAGAHARAEPWGVWGGEIFDAGAVIPVKRPRGRPRRRDAA